jgi:GNAT superfamily N-acetyltransferase
MAHQGISVVPATPERWADLAGLFRVGGDSAGCWCAWFRMPNKAFTAARAPDRRARLQGLVEGDRRPGLLAYLDGEAVGWVSIVPRSDLERIEPSDRGPAATDAGPVWAVSCFVVRPGRRRQGVAGALLDAAIDHARASGAAIVEAYPSETARTPGSAFMGVPSMYLSRGFQEAGRFDRWAAVPAASGPTPARIGRPPGRPVLRLRLR